MGLDNIPYDYPCVSRGLAIYVDEINEDGTVKRHERDGLPVKRWSCQATQEAGQCPIMHDKTRPTEGAVVGMFGTDCWYRGKWGYAVASQLGVEADELYGDEAGRIDPDMCWSLAGIITDALETYLSEHGKFLSEDGESDLEPDARYMIWWLGYMAEECDGAKAWY
jgi:hypothetical protein